MDGLTSPMRRFRRGPRRSAAARIWLLCVAGVLAVPAVAHAATMTVTGACFASGQPVTLAGTAFTPGGPVTITGAVTASAQAGTTGEFTAQIAAPSIAELGPRAVTVRVLDGLNPANAASIQLRVVRQAFGSNLPVAGRPREVTTWRFAGFAAGAPIYGHFLRDGAPQGDFRFGVAQGDCGTLTVRAPRIPGVRALRPGRWTLRLDQRMTYRAGTPGSEATFRIRRRGA
jgi:hypothetical protein